MKHLSKSIVKYSTRLAGTGVSVCVHVAHRQQESWLYGHLRVREFNNFQTLHVCHICLHWGGFGVQWGRHIWQSHGVSGIDQQFLKASNLHRTEAFVPSQNTSPSPVLRCVLRSSARPRANLSPSPPTLFNRASDGQRYVGHQNGPQNEPGERQDRRTPFAS